METRTIDDLLSYLEGKINAANPEKFRGDCMDFTRRVLVQEIGLDLINYPVEEEADVLNHVLKMPVNLLKLDDLSFDGFTWQGFEVGRDMQPLGSLAFQKNAFGYRLPNLSRGKLWVRGTGLPKDENGDTLLPREVYDALTRYCLGNLLEDYPQHPLFPTRYTIQQEAERLILKARATLNQESIASRRMARHATGQYRNFDNYNYW